MTTGNHIHNKSARFPAQNGLKRIKERVAANYTGDPETAIASTLFTILSGFGPLPAKLMNKDFLANLGGYLLPLITTSHYPKRQLLLSAGHVASSVYFSQKGLVRGFYMHKKTGKEITDFLWRERSVITVPNSFFKQQPSQLFIEAMPGTQLLSISFHHLMACLKKYPVLEIFSRNVILQYHAYETKRNHELSSLSAWERYIELLNLHPDIEQKVTKEVIASYLHIMPQSLSRMLKERGHP